MNLSLIQRNLFA